MRKRRLLVLLLICLLLGGCAGGKVAHTGNPMLDAAATLVPDTSPVLPRLYETESQHTQEAATLFFRFGSEPYLAAEDRAVLHSASQSYEYALLTQLLAGPGTQNTALRSLFPQGTRVISTVKQGRTLFVTLSAEIMNPYADEPSNWRELDAWRTEVPLRRRLCMQSLVATVTENCDVDQVQVLVQQSSASVSSLRLKQSYFLQTTDESALVGPMTRDAALVLTPDATLRIILGCWHDQDWQRLRLYMAARDPQTGAELPAQSAFIARMDALRRVIDWHSSDASISADGHCATFTVDLTLLAADGQLTQAKGRTLRLYRENGLWKTSLQQLTGWLEGES